VEGNDYQGLVATLSRIVADLSQEIADRVLTLEKAS
jgi:predicted amino acid-binding ACT domain protein